VTVAGALDRLVADLTAGGLVTPVLEAWVGAPVRAERVAAALAPTTEVREWLRVGADAPIGFRRVRLLAGDVLLSEADNWFVPDRLTQAMRQMLAASDTPFGRVIAPLDPHRETLACVRLAGDPVLLIRALVIGGDGGPLALVEERYRQVIIA